ncbi:MAG TPA: AraC family transcriptional regulator [Dyella sp.]|uniref:AraC family transcriptional regulator n=1 Tax=Dyella sp. TaxID=1869338 RepID=UPI002D7A1CD5|nr:AraC family transcriptional regulator [Dyella sp.]HET6552551.1 AraC family transcriptional regulator [Dyella sp.]
MLNVMTDNQAGATLDSAWADDGATVVLPGDGDVPRAVVARRRAGSLGEVIQAPENASVVRFPFGRCRVSVCHDGRWTYRGEASAGFAQASGPGAISRTEWLSDGEELILTVPNSFWRGRQTRRMGLMVAHGQARRHADAILQQLVQALVRSASEGVGTSFAAPLIETILERSLVAAADDKVVIPIRQEQQALAPRRMAKVTAFVRENLARPIRLGDMAEAAGLSSMHFAAQFRAATGKRPHHFLVEERVEHAKALMLGATWGLYEIAVSAGFSTQAHFCTVFKQYTGMPPNVWRVRAKAALTGMRVSA